MAKFSYGQMVQHITLGYGLITFEDAEHEGQSHVSFYEHDERWVNNEDLTHIPHPDTLRLNWLLAHDNRKGYTRSSIDRAIKNGSIATFSKPGSGKTVITCSPEMIIGS